MRAQKEEIYRCVRQLTTRIEIPDTDHIVKKALFSKRPEMLGILAQEA